MSDPYYRVVLGSMRNTSMQSVKRDTLPEALHWLADNYPLNVEDSRASILYHAHGDESHFTVVEVNPADGVYPI